MKQLSHFVKGIILFLLFFVVQPFVAQPSQLSEEAQVSMITCGTGEDLYALFGHTAIRVKDASQNVDVVFNYGMFDFNTPNFYLKFIKGDLNYELGWDYYNDFYRSYVAHNRSIVEQQLALTFEEKNNFWKNIWAEYNSDARYYQYKFIDDNCTTRALKILEESTNKKLEVNYHTAGQTYRKILNDYLSKQYLPKLGINLVFGKKVDNKSDIIFLPDHLMEALNKDQNWGATERTIFESSTTPSNDEFTFYGFLAFVVLMIAFSKRKVVQNIYLTLFILLHAILFFMQVYSHHKEILINPSLIIFNFVFILGYLVRKRKFLVFMISLGMSVLGIIFSSGEVLKVIYPVLLLHIVMLAHQLIKHKPKKNYV